MIGRRDREGEEIAWLTAHHELALVALRHFLANGEWPGVEVVQRHLDRSGLVEDVAAAISALPARPGESQRWRPTIVSIPMRVLWHLQEARPVVEAALLLVARAHAAYMSESEDPVVSSADFVDEDEATQTLLGQAARLVASDHPSPFAGGGWGPGWRLQVNDAVARVLSGVTRPEDYFDRQQELLDEAGPARFEPGGVGDRIDDRRRRVIDALHAAQIGHVSDRLVLLGAGASVEAGMPEGRQLAEAFVRNPRLPHLAQILSAVGDVGYPDVERAFSILEAIADLDQSASLLSDLRQLDLLRDERLIDSDAARGELDAVRHELRRRLWLPDGLGVGVVHAVMGTEYEPPKKVRYLKPLVSASVGGTVASLNYDNVLELASGPIAVTTEASRRVVVPDESDRYMRLLKLHGSLSWQRIGDDVISGGRPLESEHYEPAVIFGALNKLRHYGPYLDLLRAVADKLAEVHYVIVIGYGFRDPHINEAVRIWASQPAADERRKVLIACLGAAVDRLPDSVAAWRVFEHLNVVLLQEDSAVAVRTLFD